MPYKAKKKTEEKKEERTAPKEILSLSATQLGMNESKQVSKNQNTIRRKMNTDKDTSLLFANEDGIFRIVSIAKIISWIILAFYLISFAGNLSELIQGQTTWPTQLSQWPIAIANLFFAPAVGLFYFLVLQGVAQGLNLGLDIYYELHPEENEE